MIRRSLIFTLAFAAVACASPSADQPKAQAAETEAMSSGNYSSQGGNKPVGVIPDAAIRDAKRDKELELSVEYPIAAGSYPLIIWSHGYGGSSRGYVGLSSYWASFGYVVIKPTHADSGKLANVQAGEGPREVFSEPEWRARVQDITAILDAVPQLEEKYPELKGKIDMKQIGVGGHSYGAHTALLLGGVKTFPGGTSLADPRVKAVLVMSPQGPSEVRGLTKESYASLSVPTLFMTGSLDRGFTEDETPEWRRQAFELAPAGDKYLVVVEGARHATFAGRTAGMADAGGRDVVVPDFDPNADPRTRGTYIPPQSRGNTRANRRDPQLTERAVFARIKVVSAGFWDAYLHGNAKGKEFLDKLAGRQNLEMAKK
jgi:predicted dienelactone hydrolase